MTYVKFQLTRSPNGQFKCHHEQKVENQDEMLPTMIALIHSVKVLMDNFHEKPLSTDDFVNLVSDLMDYESGIKVGGG